ncbi:hypothetical protein IGI04_020227 [Brassica rapa subsp. trilocularis]|uniref:Uncharacterized protein n=1 Tax=Brassica rapa subsp. trilocularis TaxID=1813537 RepID=A0ABQ7MJR0_BRACM|nr:hypothetical protein IGI04_020227 [Brassica rapa subsp. trilocularis]
MQGSSASIKCERKGILLLEVADIRMTISFQQNLENDPKKKNTPNTAQELTLAVMYLELKTMALLKKMTLPHKENS